MNELTSKSKSVLIGMPCGSGQVPIEMLQSLLRLEKPLPCGFMSVTRQRIDKARNCIVLEALKSGIDYVLFVDDDNPIPPDTLTKMIEDDKDIVVAPILSRNPDANGVHNLCSFYMTLGPALSELNNERIRFYTPITKFTDSGPLHQIAGGGTGCMLIKRRVIEALFAKYQNHIFEFGDIRFKKITYNGVEYDRRTMSEDMEFCERATDLGFEVWLDDRIRPLHISGNRAVQWTNPE